jgi:hypothetical protein
VQRKARRPRSFVSRAEPSRMGAAAGRSSGRAGRPRPGRPSGTSHSNSNFYFILLLLLLLLSSSSSPAARGCGGPSAETTRPESKLNKTTLGRRPPGRIVQKFRFECSWNELRRAAEIGGAARGCCRCCCCRCCCRRRRRRSGCCLCRCCCCRCRRRHGPTNEMRFRLSAQPGDQRCSWPSDSGPSGARFCLSGTAGLSAPPRRQSASRSLSFRILSRPAERQAGRLARESDSSARGRWQASCQLRGSISGWKLLNCVPPLCRLGAGKKTAGRQRRPRLGGPGARRRRRP